MTAWKLWNLIQRLKLPTVMSLEEIQHELGGISKSALDRAASELEEAGIIEDSEV